MICIKNLHKSYQMASSSLHVLKGVDLDIAEGELVSIMGTSGSGKSTLLNILGMLDVADSGEYILDNVPIADLSAVKAAKYRNEFLGFIFQSFNLISYKNAVENVALPLYYRNIPKKERHEKAMHYLEKVGLADWAKHHPNEMSGGQNQRVAIARALITEPKVLLADEPTGALDTKSSFEIMELIKGINQEGKTILIITHDPEIAAQTNRVIHFKDGLIARKEDIKPEPVYELKSA